MEPMETMEFLVLDEPRMVDHGAMRIAGVQERYRQDNAHVGIPALWSRFHEMAGGIPGAIAGAAYGVSTNVDAACSFDYLAGLEVERDAVLPRRIAVLDIAPHRYAVFTYSGPIWDIKRVYHTIFNQWLPGSRHAAANSPTLERYTEEYDRETGVCRFELWLPLQA
jgi:AraC family transcriptional regulator